MKENAFARCFDKLMSVVEFPLEQLKHVKNIPLRWVVAIPAFSCFVGLFVLLSMPILLCILLDTTYEIVMND